MELTGTTRFLERERACLETFCPGLDASLRELGLPRLEHETGLGVQTVKSAGIARLCIPHSYSGAGATPRQAAYVARAVAARAPSAAVATAMHHFSVATLVELARRSSGMEWLVLEAIAKNGLLVASAFAEGDRQGRILQPHLQVESSERGLLVSGVKRPCSLSQSMDLISVSLVSPESAEFPRGRLAVGLISSQAQGIAVRPFWSSPALAAAETGEVTFDSVLLDSRMIAYSGAPNALDDLQTLGLAWFQLLISATYLGIASALVERVLVRDRIAMNEAARLVVTLEGAMSTLVGLASAIEEDPPDQAMLARSLYCRYSVQEAIERASALAVEWGGGLQFATCPEVALLFAATRALAFHPPSRTKMFDRLGAYITGDRLHEI